MASKSSASTQPLNTTHAKGFNWWTIDDMRRFVEMAERLKMSPADLLIVLYAESGLHPGASNPGPPPNIAVGLNQIVASTAKAMGMTEAERLSMLHMSVSEQLPYVERYFKHIPWVAAGHAFESAAQIYVANFAPAFLSRGSDPSTVLYARGTSGRAYDLNSGFDVEKKGTITVGDLARALARRSREGIFLSALQMLRDVTGQPTLSPHL